MKKLNAYLVAAAMALPMATMALPEIVGIEADQVFSGEKGALRGLVITLDPGHGGSAHTPGYSGSARGIESRVVEGDLNMRVAALLRHFLRQAGAQVHMTRFDDRRVTLNNESGDATGRSEELGARVQMAEDTKSHLFLSLHHNSAPRKTADGVVILIWPTDSQGEEQPLEVSFADYLENEVRLQVPNKEDFPHYLSEHPLVAGSDIPSAVVEFGFLSNADFDAWVSQNGSHRAEALGVYNAVVSFWKDHQEQLDEKRLELFPELAERGKQDREGGENDWRRGRFAGLARQLWPSKEMPTEPSQFEAIVNLYKYARLADRSTFLLESKVTETEEGLHLELTGNVPTIMNAAELLLKEFDVEFASVEKRLLPDSERLENREYGVVQLPMAFTWARPEEGAVVQTQVLLGESIFLLDRSDDGEYYRIHAANGYIGWVRRDAVLTMTKDEFTDWNLQRMVRVKNDSMVDDFHVPAGAMLPFVDRGDGGVRVKLPMGVRATGGNREATLPVENVLMPSEVWPGRTVAENAKKMLWAPYVFGGKTSQGIDCSGFVAVSYNSVGLEMPRDAYQQALVGQLVGTPWYTDGIQAGDSLFFMDSTGRISHTGIALGGGRFIHAATPMVHVGSFNPDDELYDKGTIDRFAFARRPIVP